MSLKTSAGDLESVIRQTWGHTSIRPIQREAMDAVLSGKDTLVVLSTGGGKSLCYQAPALLLDGITLVLSPLIALMKDQVDALREAGVAAASIHSSSTLAERTETRRLAESGTLKLLYVAPERLSSDSFLHWLTERVPIRLLAVDEAHCISTWGHNFRPEYRQISLLRQRLNQATVLACTATATPKVADDISNQLGLNNPVRLIGSFDRPNFTYRVLPQRDSEARIRAIIHRFSGQAGIVYCLSRKKTETLAASLQAAGIRALPYHAGLDASIRHYNHEAFLAGDCDIMIATVAFGMGIDKPDIRFVIHIGIPESLENYQQETGRAGRDGEPAECTLLFSYGDVIRWRKNAESSPPELAAILKSRLKSIQDYAETSQCRRRILLGHFGEKHPGGCNQCDRCRPELADDGPLETVVRRRGLRTDNADHSVAPANNRFTPAPDILVPADQQVPQKILSHFARARIPLSPETAACGLLGSSNEQITQLGHDQLSTFALLQNHRPDEVYYWIKQLQIAGCLEFVHSTLSTDTDSDSPQLQMTSKGNDVMRGREQVELRYPKSHFTFQRSAESTRHSPLPPSIADSTDDDDAVQQRFELLRHWRSDLARQRKVSAFIIFHDRVLKEIAKQNPRTLQQLADIPGIGISRLNQYGATLLEVLGGF